MNAGPWIGDQARVAATARWVALAIAVVALPFAGCAKKGAPLAPAAPLPPEIESVFPADRSTGVDYETPIWVRFREPLDPATVNPRTVFLKVDTRRIPIEVRYESATGRIVLVPLDPLQLRATHTVELAAEIATADGTPLGTTGFWQFTVIGLRRPGHPFPQDGAVDESPVATLAWDATERSAGDIAYDVYLATDSAQVAARAAPAFLHTTRALHLPAVRWALGTRYYWAVSASNLSTSERFDSAVWRFATVPASASLDSMVLTMSRWGYYYSSTFQTLIRCGLSTILMGSSFSTKAHAAAGFDLSALGPGLRLADASLVMTASGSPDLTANFIGLWGATAEWNACGIGLDGPPYQDRDIGQLALREVLTGRRVRFSGAAFAAHLEATVRRGGLYGYDFRTNTSVSFYTPLATNSTTVWPALTLYFYRGPVPAARGGPAGAAGAVGGPSAAAGRASFAHAARPAGAR